MRISDWSSDVCSSDLSFATLIRRAGGRRVAVGYDGRLSSPMLEAALVAGLNAAGIDALRVGMGPTPMLYYAASTQKVDGGIQITGSHNPPDYNGFKMVFQGRSEEHTSELQSLMRISYAVFCLKKN